MKKGLIIGAAGFVGNYLIEEMIKNGIVAYATKLPHEKLENSNAKIYDLDIMDKEAIVALLFEIRPDYIFHLAAQSSVGYAWKNPGLTVDVNIKGSLNVMDAIRELFYKPRVLLIGSGEEYGHILPEEIERIIDGKDRQLAGPTPPAKGLTLVEIRYPNYQKY